MKITLKYFVERHADSVNAFVFVLLFPFIASSVWGVFWGFVGSGGSYHGASAGEVSDARLPDSPLMAGYNPFSERVAIEAIRKTTLKLKLWGVLVLDDGQSRAIIGKLSDDIALSYSIDDELPGGAVIQSIKKDYVVIKNGGVSERLDVRKKELTGTLQLGASEQVTKGSRAELSLKDIMFIPVFERMEVVGFQVTGRNSEELLARYGFKKNDIAVSVNGRDLSEFSSMIEVADHMSGQEVAVRIKRNGKYKEIRLELD